MKRCAILAWLISGVIVSSVAFAEPASTSSSDPYWTLSTMRVESDFDSVTLPLNSRDGRAPIDWAQVINIGKAAWQVIVANKPVVNVSSDVAHALPKGILSVSELDSWQGPRMGSTRVVFSNLMGIDVVTLEFEVSFLHNGNYRGVGQYVGNLAIVPKEVSVLWGFTVDADIKILETANQGTAKNPLASAQALVHYQVKTPLKDEQHTFSFFARGNGDLLGF